MSELEVIKVSDLDEEKKDPDWLIEGLWLDGGVGIIGGEPKSYKTFAALSLAVATASGRSCFGRYDVKRQGPVLVYAAEDSLAMVADRIIGLAHGMNASFKELDIHLIAEARLRIDTEVDRQRLEETISNLRPVLLILDPFVRLHGIDENSSGEVAKLLSWLRHLQRHYSINVAMVHHARKRAGKERPGQSLRGSSELHAWGDSNIYLRRGTDDEPYVEMTIEHRAAPSEGNLRLQFIDSERGPYLAYDGGGCPMKEKLSSADRILEALGKQKATGDALRKESGMKAATFWSELRDLLETGQIVKGADSRYHLPENTHSTVQP